MSSLVTAKLGIPSLKGGGEFVIEDVYADHPEYMEQATRMEIVEKPEKSLLPWISEHLAPTSIPCPKQNRAGC